jgi:putative peptidoglycan lipid II flippase
LIGGGVWGGLTPVGVMGPAIGMVVGAVAHLLVQAPGLVRYRARYAPTLGRHDPGVARVGLLIAPRALGMAAAQINLIVINNLASRLGSGAISSLEYAWRVMLLPQGIFAQAVGTAAFPTFSKLAALGQMDALRTTLTNALRMLIALTIPASVGMVLLGEPIVALMFQRGAFDALSTRAVAWALSFFALGLVGHSALEVLGRTFYALHDTWTPAGAAVLSVVLNGLLGMVLPAAFERAGWMPLGGLALATAMAALVEMLTLLLFIHRRLGDFDARPILLTTLRVLAASLGMGVAVRIAARAAPPQPLVQVLVGVPVGVLVYGALAWLLGVTEFRSVVRMMMRRVVRQT